MASLTTLAGNDIAVLVLVRVESLPTVSQPDTFGCEIDLLHPHTQEALADPIQDALRNNTHFQLVVRQCFVVYEHKHQIQGEDYLDYPRAVWIPANTAGVIPSNAFSSVPRLRHVWAEPTLHTVEREAWQKCYQLQIVKLPSTVVSTQNSAFQGCFALVTVVVPGCVDFGVRTFAVCCALEQVGAIENGANVIAPGATLAPYVFESCIKLSQISLPQTMTRPKVLPIPPPYSPREPKDL